MSFQTEISTLGQRFESALRCRDARLNALENVPEWPNGCPVSVDLGAGALQNYGDAFGHRSLREEIAMRAHSIGHLSIDMENIAVSNGGLHALDVIFSEFCGDDTVLFVQTPVLRSIAELALQHNCTLVPLGDLTTEAARRRALDCIRTSGAKTKRPMVYLNTPNNPTGTILDTAFVQRVQKAINAFQGYLILDEVYDAYCFDSAPIQDLDLTGLFRIGSMSKAFGLPGIRIGWVASTRQNAAKLAANLEIKCISVAGPSQKIAVEMLRRGPADELFLQIENNRKKAAANHKLMALCARNLPAGGTSLWADQLDVDTEQFATWLAETERLFVASGSNYWPDNVQGIRLPLGISSERFSLVTERLCSGLSQFKSQLQKETVHV